MDRKTNHLNITIFLFILLFSLLAAISQSQNESTRHGLKIDHKYLEKDSSGIILDFDHQQGQKISNDLVLKIKNGQGKTYFQNVSQIGNNSIGHKISLNSQQIKNIFLQSQSSIKIKKNGRVLLSIQQLPFLFIIVTKFFSYFFSCCRNMIIIATITGTFDLWMPLLLFVESFICLGFWTHDPHLFTQIYSRIFNSNLDVFNLIRLSLSSETELSRNPYLANFGFTNRFAINCSGELSMLLIVLIGIFILKLLTLFVKSQKLRSIGPKIRPMFNGYMFWVTPRILSLAGLSLRLIQTNVSIMQIINLGLAALSIIGVIVYFILLIIQIRKINTKLQYLQESKNQIGLASRIDYLKDFQFDCLEYSMLYYPAMNLIRIIFSHLCIGFAPDFHYVQFGGVIFGQVFYMMIQISCSGYKLTRDKVFYPIIDFVYGTFLLTLIGIGLIYGVGHLELTMNLEKYAFSAIIFILAILIIQTLLDIVLHIRSMRQSESQQFQTPKKFKQNSVKSFDQQKDKKIQKYESDDLHTNEQQQKRQKTKSKETSGKKIKKVKNGKLI